MSDIFDLINQHLDPDEPKTAPDGATYALDAMKSPEMGELLRQERDDSEKAYKRALLKVGMVFWTIRYEHGRKTERDEIAETALQEQIETLVQDGQASAVTWGETFAAFPTADGLSVLAKALEGVDSETQARLILSLLQHQIPLPR